MEILNLFTHLLIVVVHFRLENLPDYLFMGTMIDNIFLEDSTNPSLGETLLGDIQKFLKNSENPRQESKVRESVFTRSDTTPSY